MASSRTLRRASVTLVLVALVATACTSDDDTRGTGQDSNTAVPHHTYVSRPDLTPPAISRTDGPAAGEAGAPTSESGEYIFLGLRNAASNPLTGRMIVDTDGEPVWVEPTGEDNGNWRNYDFRRQEYQGEPVLTWYDGESATGFGNGDVTMADSSYEEIATVTTGGELDPGRVDLHETTVTPAGTMLVPAYIETPADLSGIGGPEDGWVYDGVLQEVDIATGEVVFEWRSLDHIPITDNEQDFAAEQEENEDLGTEDAPFDYFHINSITEDDDGSLLVSARNTHAIYQLDRESGAVNWILGGKSSDFDLGDGVYFAWQHDAERQPDGTLTLFDNQAGPQIGEQSRGLRLELDTDEMTAEVVTEYLAPSIRVASSMGSFQQLENGNVLIGWGSEPYYSEHTPDGDLIYDAWLGGGGNYRAYRAPWTGEPNVPPDVVVQQSESDATAYVSWNGSTETEQWRLLTGDDEASAAEYTTVDRTGFETAIPAPSDAGYIAVEALDANGQVLETGIAEFQDK